MKPLSGAAQTDIRRSFYLGGGVGSGEDCLFKFKRAFYKGDLNHFCILERRFMTKKPIIS